MKMLRFFTLIFLLIVLVTGCGSGSNSTQTRAILTISTSGSIPSGQSLAGIGMTIALPPGVAPALDTSGQVDTERLVTHSGVTAASGLVATALYLEATAVQPARISIVVASKAKAGFGVGECMVLTLKRSAGATPGANEFGIAEFSAANLDGAAVTGLQAAITEVMLR